jgi:uncharacterized radical SAM protein YgiQ
MPDLKKFVPMTRQEMTARAWDELDILFISGDAYIDHHSFGIPLLARFLMHKGYRVGIIAQPKTVEDIKKLGTAKLFIGIGTGVVDSMLNNYTADKKPRRDDEYSPGGKGGKRPDNAGIAYSKMARLAFPKTLIIGGGVEIALRRLSHYDYWQNKVLPSILFTGEFDLIVYGMGEKTTLEICEALKRNKKDEIKKIRGIAYVAEKEEARLIENRITIPSHEEVKDDKKKFLKAVNLYSEEINPYNAKTIVQYYRNKAVVISPPPLPLTEAEMDQIYDLDFTKEQHWSYKEKIPALDMIRFSIISNRGCFGGCSFCSITLHQGKIVQSRSQNSIIKEIKKLLSMPEFKGIVTDIGGPTANMYMLCCTDKEAQKICKRTSCLYPSICNKLKTSHKEQVELLKTILKIQGIRKVFIASGVRYDLAICDKEYLKQLISEHVSGQLKVAPEHKDPKVLELMRKPSFEVFLKFREIFNSISKLASKEQYLVPYFISSFPGSTDAKMLDLENWLKKEHWKLQQIQNFIPLPMTLASAMYWTSLDYKTKETIHVPKTQEERKKQKLNLQSYKKK